MTTLRPYDLDPREVIDSSYTMLDNEYENALGNVDRYSRLAEGELSDGNSAAAAVMAQLSQAYAVKAQALATRLAAVEKLHKLDL